MALDAVKNFAIATVATVPSGTSGTSIVLTTGHGARMPAVPFNAVIWDLGTSANPASAYHAGKAEIVRVTNVATDTLTVTRAQESTAAVNFTGLTCGFAATMTAKMIADIVTEIAAGGGGGGDHGALTGLGDDDHALYLLKSGLRDWDEQASDPSTPASTKWKLYFKAGGLYLMDDTGAVIGPLGTGGGGASGTKTYADLGPQDAEPPNTNYAQPYETANYHPVLAFDKTTEEATRWTRIMPEGASLASGLKVRLHVLAGTLTTGVSRWGVAIERMDGSIAADGYDTEVEGDLTTAGAANTIAVLELTITTIDGVVAGDAYRIKVARKAAHANDTLDEDAWLRRVEVRSAA